MLSRRFPYKTAFENTATITMDILLARRAEIGYDYVSKQYALDLVTEPLKEFLRASDHIVARALESKFKAEKIGEFFKEILSKILRNATVILGDHSEWKTWNWEARMDAIMTAIVGVSPLFREE